MAAQTRDISPEELKVIERLKKLHNMATSAREVGNLAEADSFMEGVSKTLAKHNLDQSVLALDLRELTDPLDYEGCYGATKRGRDKPQEWIHDLAVSVAHAHFCAMNYHVASSYVWFYGRRSNVQTAKRMFLYLRDMAEREGMKAWSRQIRTIKAAYGYRVQSETSINWYLSWLGGFADEVGRRYYQMRARVESDRGMSVVLVSVRKEANDYAKSNLGDPEKVKEETKEIQQSGSHWEARDGGKQVAKSANLRPHNLDDGAKPSTTKLLGGGN